MGIHYELVFHLFSELKCMTQNGLHACMYQPWEKPFFQRKIISAKKKMVFNTNSIRTSLVGLPW